MALATHELDLYCPLVNLEEVVRDLFPYTCEQNCAICLEPLVDRVTFIFLFRKILACGHLFHDSCISQWLTKSDDSCPLCRKRSAQRAPIDISTRSIRHSIERVNAIIDRIDILLARARSLGIMS